MLRITAWASRLLAVTVISVTASCGGSGSGSIEAENSAPIPPSELPPQAPDFPSLDFSPAIPTPGDPTSSQSSTPIALLTLNYPESGILAGNRLIVSAFLEDSDSMSTGKLVWQRTFLTNGETSRQIQIYLEEPFTSLVQNGDVILLVDVVVFSDNEQSGSQLEYAAVPRSRLVFSPQEQPGGILYDRISLTRQLEPVQLASTTSAARYVETLSPSDNDGAIVIEHSSFFKNKLYLLVNYTDACANDDFEVMFQVSDLDLRNNQISTGVRRTSTARCGGETSRLLTVSLDELAARYAATNSTVFDEIELLGIGSFKPEAQTFDTATRFGTEPFCASRPSCVLDVVLNTDGTVDIESYVGQTWRTNYSIAADGRTIYLEPYSSLIPPNSYALLSEDGRSMTLSFIGFELLAQPDTYTFLRVEGSVDVPALDTLHSYHASIILFAAGEGGIDVLARARITDFSVENADFQIEYRAEDLPSAGPVALQVAAAVFSAEEQAVAPAALEYRSPHLENELLFYDANADAKVFESQLNAQVVVNEFNGSANQITAEVIDQALPVDAEQIADLQFSSIDGDFLHLVLGGQSACQVAGGRFQLYYLPDNAVPLSGLPNRWLDGSDAPCATPSEAQVSIDLRPLVLKRAALGEPALETLKIAGYGVYTPTLTPFPEHRVYADSADCFVQDTCDTYLDFRTDGTLHYKRSTFTGSATYGVSIDSRTIFSQGIPLPREATTVFLSTDGLSMASSYAGQLVRQL